MLARVQTATLTGFEATAVGAEVEVRGGTSKFTLIGLGDTAVRESRDRILSALQHSGFKPPTQILINLSPAELKKEGAQFDLPIALAILAASGQLDPAALAGRWFFGELSLDGQVRAVRGIISLVAEVMRKNGAEAIVPRANWPEADLLGDLPTSGFCNLGEVVRYLRGTDPCPERLATDNTPTAPPTRGTLDEIRGQEIAKRALLVAAAGGHHLLFIGPPGCGKSMLASRFGSLLPPLSQKEKLEVIQLHSLTGEPLSGLLAGYRPFRNPHYHMSESGFLGAGAGSMRPGELALAHRGVLFLDELPEFRRPVLEALRTPLESGEVRLARARGNVTYPARVQVIAAMNPCPCGRGAGSEGRCLCSPSTIDRYLHKISQPLLDRLDIHLELKPVPIADLFVEPKEEATNDGERFLEMVLEARERQLRRQGVLNADLSLERLQSTAMHGCKELLEHASKRLGLSARSVTRVLRVARTLADLESQPQLLDRHLAEALSFRNVERMKARHY